MVASPVAVSSSAEPSSVLAPSSPAAPATRPNPPRLRRLHARRAAGGGATDNDKPGKAVTIGFSAPAADHGWIAAIAKNAKAQAAQYSDVTFTPVEPTNDINQQISAVESLIQKKVGALVL